LIRKADKETWIMKHHDETLCFKRFRKKQLKLIKCSLMDIEGENFKAAGCMME